MKTQTIYIAEDGTRFDDSEKCLLYEDQCRNIEQAMSGLKPIPKDGSLNFANGGGYIQQSKSSALKAYKALLEVAEDVVGKVIVEKTKYEGEFLPRSIIGRFIDDSKHRSLYAAWIRLMNLDTQWREWGQGYYAANPKEGKQVELD